MLDETKRRQILEEVVAEFGRKEWFRDATVYSQHPLTNQPLLELKVNYRPIYERPLVQAFGAKYSLGISYIQVDQAGNPVE